MELNDEEMDFMKKMMVFVSKWHGDQTDKAGRPYIEHLLAVAWMAMTYAEALGKSKEYIKEICVLGFCHDLFEDTNCTGKDIVNFLKEIGITDKYLITYDMFAEGDTLIDDLCYLTKHEDDDYTKYICYIIAKGEKASLVKYADLLHNSDANRLTKYTDDDKIRMEKYHTACYIIDQEWNFTQRIHDAFEKEGKAN